MAMRPEFRDFLLELFEPFGAVRMKGMFGGTGLYSGDVFFGLVFDERIYFKADDLTRADYEAEGRGNFTFTNSTGEIIATSYFEIPERLYDDPEDLAAWTRRAVEAQIRSKAKKKRRPAHAVGPPAAAAPQTRTPRRSGR